MKHAFLILAHDNIDLLKRLIKSIDHKNSNIYVHIDKRMHFSKNDRKELFELVTAGRLTLIPRIKVAWGGYSIINCEIRMLRCAIDDQNDYYHLLSGHDYLLVDINSFMSFFEKHNGEEFIQFTENTQNKKHRYCVYHYFQNYVGKDKKHILYLINRAIVKIQIWIEIDRTKKLGNYIFEKGSQWFSLTRRFVQYVLSQDKTVEHLFKYSFCCDEIFIQTLYCNSCEGFILFKGETGLCKFGDNMRAIDWARGKPYVYTASDYRDLVESGKLICRKVDNDTEEHRELLNLLDEHCCREK